MNQGAFCLALHCPKQSTWLYKANNPDGEALIATQGKGSCVHNPKILRDGFIKAKRFKPSGIGHLKWVGAVNPIDLGGL
jgi:hypothetical protein